VLEHVLDAECWCWYRGVWGGTIRLVEFVVIRLPIGPFSLVPPAPPHSSRHNDTTSPPVAAAAATTAPTPRVSVPDCGGFDSLIGLRREKLALASTVLLPYARARRWAEDEADADADAERQSSSSSPLLTPSFILLYGPPGVGKTGERACEDE